MYKVLHYFTDLQDSDYAYHEGDIFPHEGLEVAPERFEELASTRNKQGKILIEKIPEKVKKKKERDSDAGIANRPMPKFE